MHEDRLARDDGLELTRIDAASVRRLERENAEPRLERDVLGVSESWCYKWKNRPLAPRQQRRARLDADVRRSDIESDGDYGSPRVVEDLREWRVSTKTVAASMSHQGLVGRRRGAGSVL